jgi:hypothetical protein
MAQEARHDGHTTSGRRSSRLRKDLADRIKQFERVVDTTEKEEAKVRWMLDEFLLAYSDGTIPLETLYPNWLVGLESLSKAIERRVKAQYMKSRLITPEQLMIIFRLVGDILESRISDQGEKQLAAQDIASLIMGQGGILPHPHYQHPRLPETNAVRIIDSAIYQRPMDESGPASPFESEDAAGDDATQCVAGESRELSSPLWAEEVD